MAEEKLIRKGRQAMRASEKKMSREEAAHALQFFTGVRPTQEEMDAVGRLEITVRSHTSGKVRKLVYNNDNQCKPKP